MLEGFMADPKRDTLTSSFGKGAITGGTALAGLYGLWELKRYLMKKLYSKAEIFPDDYMITFDAPIMKEDKALLEKRKKQLLESQTGLPESQTGMPKQALMEDQKKYFMYGLGIPVGAMLAYNTYDYMRDKEEELKLRSKIRELEKAIRGSHQIQPVIDEQKRIEQPPLTQELELAKMKKDAFLNAALDKAMSDGLNKEAVGEGIRGYISSMLDLMNVLGPKFAFKYGPMMYGALVPIGGLVGWKAGELLLNPADAAKPKDVVGRLNLAYKYEPSKYKTILPMADEDKEREQRRLDIIRTAALAELPQLEKQAWLPLALAAANLAYPTYQWAKGGPAPSWTDFALAGASVLPFGLGKFAPKLAQGAMRNMQWGNKLSRGLQASAQSGFKGTQNVINTGVNIGTGLSIAGHAAGEAYDAAGKKIDKYIGTKIKDYALPAAGLVAGAAGIGSVFGNAMSNKGMTNNPVQPQSQGNNASITDRVANAYKTYKT